MENLFYFYMMVDPKKIQELLNIYLDDVPRLLNTLRLAYTQGDAETFFRSAHSLKSSSAQLGVVKLSAYNKELEEIERKGDLSGDQVRLLIEQSEAEYIKVKGIFQEAFEH